MAFGVPGGVLRYRADVRTIGFASIFFGIVALQWYLFEYTWLHLLPAPLGVSAAWSWWTPARLVGSVGLFMLACLFAFIGAISTHNVIHCPMFRRAWMNEAWRLVQTLWYGQPVSVFIPVHNHSHHKYAQTRRDLTRSTKVKGSWQLWNMYAATGWQSAALRDCVAYFRAQRARGRAVWRNVLVELAVLVPVLLVLFVIDWRRALLFVVLPHSVGMFLIKAINFLQHDGCDYDMEGVNHSRNFVGPVFNWLLLNNGYHTIHHMRPGIHWSLLPQKHAELVAPSIHPALDVPNFVTWFVPNVVWPGRRQRFDGAPYEWPPGGEGPDLPWAFELEALYQHDTGRSPMSPTT